MATNAIVRSTRPRMRWGGGQLLGQSGLAGPTDYASGIVARSEADGCGLQLKVPAPGRIWFSARPPQHALVAGDYFELTLDGGHEIRGVFVDAWHLLIAGGCKVEGEDYAVLRQGGLTLVGVKQRLDPSHLLCDVEAECDRRHAWYDEVSSRCVAPADHGLTGHGLAEALTKAVLGFRSQIQSPEGQLTVRWTTPDRWPHRDMWLWDSVFHAFGLRHIDPQLARDAVEAVFCVQSDDGFIAHQASPVRRTNITQPPLLAFAVERLVHDTGDRAWGRKLFEPLKRYLAWNERHRDQDGNGLLEWFIEDNVHCRSGESGMDNSPRFDEAITLDAVDFNAFMASEYRAMNRLAITLGLDEEAALYKSRWRSHNELINRYLWDEEAGFYCDFDPAAGRRTAVLASSGFLPLFCGAASREQAERLVRHLGDPDTFGAPLPVPSVALNSPSYAKDMWRGPVWINLNWLIAHGLRDYGYHAEARRIVDLSVAEMVRQYQSHGTFFEYYDAQLTDDPPRLLRKGQNAPQASPYHQVIHEFGWTASLFVDMVLISEPA